MIARADKADALARPRGAAPSRVLPIIASVVFVVVIGAAAWIATSLATRTGLVRHSLTVETSLSDLLSSLQDAETGQRGYLLTGDEAYLAPHTRATKAVGAEFTALNAATADNPPQAQALSELRAVADSRLAILRRAIDLQRAGDMAGALGVVRFDHGRDLMDHARAIIAGMRIEEARVLARRSAEAAFFSRALLGVIAASGILALFAIGLWLRGMHRYARVLERARGDLHFANTELEAKVAERTAELRDSNDEIQRFAYIVSHDLRAPLVNIMGFTSELEAAREDIRAELPETSKSQAIDHDLTEALGFIKAAIAKMDRLIGAILTISREGRRAFRPEPLDMAALVQGLADAQRHQADEVGAVVEIGSLPAMTADRLAVEQVFGNLIDNAIKYLDPGRAGRIEVSGKALGSRVRYEVRDNGRGIASRDHGRVFELFRRAGAQDKPGEGIGLAHVRALVRSMGGRIDVASEPDVGTTFTVTLPRMPPTV
ncbi:MAG: CHASE3 domain-containing protein [Acetobacteraceae bacterium]